MSYLIVHIKPTTIEKVVALRNKLEKYDIVESVEAHNGAAEQSVQRTSEQVVAERRAEIEKELLKIYGE